MTLIEKISQLEIKVESTNEKKSFEQLSSALKDYHKMIDEGKIIPKESTVQFLYYPTKLKSNMNF